MNVFRLHENPETSAKHHCDEHVVKLILEAGQLLCTALRLNGRDDDFLYGKGWQHHKLTKWIASGDENFAYVHDLARYLAQEKEYRYGGSHKTWDEVLSRVDRKPDCIPEGSDPQPLSVADDCMFDDEVLSYRVYYITKKDFASWDNGRDPPEWYTERKPLEKIDSSEHPEFV